MCMICDANAEIDQLQQKLVAIAEGVLDATTDDDSAITVVAMDGDIPADTSTDATIDIGLSLTGELEVVGDRDWFAVEFEAGVTYDISLDGVDVEGVDAVADTYLYLYDTNGNFIADNDDANGSLFSFLNFTADEDATYYIGVGSYDDSYAGGYELSVAEGEPPEPLRDYTMDEIGNYLTDGFWARRSFGDTNITYNVEGITMIDAAGNEVADTAVIGLIERALEAWSELSTLTFTRTTDANAGITFDDEEAGAFAGPGQIGDGAVTDAIVNVGQDWLDAYGKDLNSYTYQTYLHEIGHALGLGHGGPYNGSATYGTDNIYLNDTWGTTVMSYFSQGEAGFGSTRLVLGLQAADIVAIQDLYGVNTTTRSGDTTYGYNATDAGSIYDFQNWVDTGFMPPSFSIYDTDGIDTLDLGVGTADQVISLVQETWSSVDDGAGNLMVNLISIGRGAVIENAVGGDGDDTFTGNAADNVLVGGAGLDTVVYDVASADELDVLALGGDAYSITSAFGEDTLVGIEQVRVGEDIFDIDALANPVVINEFMGDVTEERIVGTAGVDRIDARGGDDKLFGADGNDILLGGTGSDLLVGGAGGDVLDGGSGSRDRADYRDATAGVVASLLDASSNAGDAAGDSYISVEWLGGSAFADTLTGDDARNNLYGKAGDDTLNGAGGRDRLYGEEGDDTLDGGEGNDVLYGGVGDDILSGGFDTDYLFGGDGTDILVGGAGNDRLFGGEGADMLDGGVGIDSADYRDATAGVTLSLNDGGSGGEAAGDFYVGIERVLGSAFDDVMSLAGSAGDDLRLYGRDGDDALEGSDGNNSLYGGEGNDTLAGGAGRDRMLGGNGDDVIDGGAGNDRLYGGDGADVFLFGLGDGADRLYDFEDGMDLVDLRGAFTAAELDAALAGATTTSTGVRLDFGNGDRLDFDGVDLADITAEDFLVDLVA